MNIIICAKLSPDASDIEVKAGGVISLERAEWIIGNFDLQALEAGVRLAEATSGKVTVLSAGPHQINQSKLKKDLLSRGPDELVMVVDDKLKDADTAVTAQVLAAAVKKIGTFDLILCGEGSADLYFQQVGLQLGERMNLPALNAIAKIETVDGKIRVERSLEDDIEVLEVPLPAVLSVTTDINPPRLPTMKEILKAGKKPVVEWSLKDLELNQPLNGSIEIVSLNAPPRAERKKVLIPGSVDDAVNALAGYLSKERII